MLKINTLENTSFQEIAVAFNSAFSSYSPPVFWTKEQFETKFATEGGRLDLSAGVFDDEKLVAFILHFAKVSHGKKYIYNGGTGVIPTHRGNGLTSKVFDFIAPKLKDAGVDQMILEVFTENLSAFKIYQSRGFEIKREVHCFKGQLNETSKTPLEAPYSIEELTNVDWEKAQSFWDYKPSWQNSISTLKNMAGQNVHLGLLKNKALVGYLIYNPKLKRIHQLAIDKDHRGKGLGSHLLGCVAQREKQDITFTNVDARTKNFKSFLENRGLKNYVNQYEMEFTLTSDH